MSRLFHPKQRSHFKPSPTTQVGCDGRSVYGFTLIELLIVIAVIGILASLLTSALSRTKERAQGAFCVNNTRQLHLAWAIYSDDHDGRLAYNLEMNGKGASATASSKTNLNWVNNVMDWELNSDNIDPTGNTEASLGHYTSKSANIYRCPADYALSDVQRKAGWSARVRSYSMNAMVGDAGDVSQSGKNQNNPDYVQFFSMTAIPHPADIFVFLDEHPDSINDGYFLNKAVETASTSSYSGGSHAEWTDLPASYHNGAASFSFADGHSESRRWIVGSTKRPPLPESAPLPMYLKADERADFNWVLEHMSVDRDNYFHK